MVTQRPISLGTPHGRRTRWTPPLMACAAAVVIGALWSGLVHLGLPLPEGGTSLHEGHGPMMILGFLGTVITLERAVALGQPWAYLGPATAGLGGGAGRVGAPAALGPSSEERRGGEAGRERRSGRGHR